MNRGIERRKAGCGMERSKERGVGRRIWRR